MCAQVGPCKDLDGAKSPLSLRLRIGKAAVERALAHIRVRIVVSICALVLLWMSVKIRVATTKMLFVYIDASRNQDSCSLCVKCAWISRFSRYLGMISLDTMQHC